MKQLSKLQSALFLVGGLLMVIAVGLFVFGVVPAWASLFMLVGSILFSAMQLQQRYDGPSITIRRLRRIMTVADVLFVFSGLLMAEQMWRVVYRFAATTVGGSTMWVNLVWNNWVVTLLIGAILEMYTMHRISQELSKN